MGPGSGRSGSGFFFPLPGLLEVDSTSRLFHPTSTLWDLEVAGLEVEKSGKKSHETLSTQRWVLQKHRCGSSSGEVLDVTFLSRGFESRKILFISNALNSSHNQMSCSSTGVISIGENYSVKNVPCFEVVFFERFQHWCLWVPPLKLLLWLDSLANHTDYPFFTGEPYKVSIFPLPGLKFEAWIPPRNPGLKFGTLEVDVKHFTKSA